MASALALLILPRVSAVAHGQQPTAQSTSEIERSVLKVEAPHDTGTAFIFFVSPDGTAYAITALHVVPEYKEATSQDYKVNFQTGESTTAIVWKAYKDLDLAILVIDKVPKDTKPLRLGFSAGIQDGQSIFLYGYPRGGILRRDDGHISARSLDRLLLNGINPDHGKDRKSVV